MEIEEPARGPAEPALTAFTGYLVRRAFVRSAWHAAKIMERHPRDMAILGVISGRGPISQARLAELLHVNRSVMVKVADQLESEGLLTRERDPSDRRRYALRTTGEGERLLAGLMERGTEAEDLVLRDLGPRERERLGGLLTRLIPDLVAEVPAFLGGRVAFLLAHVHNRLRENADDDLRDLGISPRHFGLLTTIDALEPCSQQNLAERMCVTGPAIVQSIDDLDRAGLVTRERNPADRREHLLRLTPAGHDHLAGARGVMTALQGRITAGLGAAQTAELNALLARIDG